MKIKRMPTILVAVVAALASVVLLVGCGDAGKEYVIRYTDDSGAHRLAVSSGVPYYLEIVPARRGYIFEGLFDAEIGGTRYVSESGASLAPFTAEKDMTLFPRFKAKEYGVILDYQGADVIGDRRFTVAYDSSLPELPKYLVGAHKTFLGWYTKANCEGTRVFDEHGAIPNVSTLNDTNFDLSDDTITLYAGFEIEKLTVTCFFGADVQSEDIEIEYDTYASEIVTKTRVNGKAPIAWSKTIGGKVWNGKITDAVSLYAVEYAPIIELDNNGGAGPNVVIARAGDAVALPKPTKAGFVFAGWYTAGKDRYTTATMPAVGIGLKAGWYKAGEISKVLLTDAETVSLSDRNRRSTQQAYVLEINELVGNYFEGMIVDVSVHFKYMNEKNSGYYDVCMTSAVDINAATTYWEEKIYADGNKNFRKIDLKATVSLKTSVLYLIFRPLPYYGEVCTAMKDLYCTVAYPDTAKLYL